MTTIRFALQLLGIGLVIVTLVVAADPAGIRRLLEHRRFHREMRRRQAHAVWGGWS